MQWNWQLLEWPNFIFNSELVLPLEKQFLLSEGKTSAFLTAVPKNDREEFIVEILTLEGAESAKIEGEILDRESLQSSIRRHFGLSPSQKKEKEKEIGMSYALMDVYQTFNTPLDHATLFRWHNLLFSYDQYLTDKGCG